MKKFLAIILTVCAVISTTQLSLAEPTETVSSYTFLDDKALLDRFTQKYSEEPKEILLAMIQDETLESIKVAAAVRTFRKRYSTEVFSKEKRIIEKMLLRRLNRTDSSFVQVEIMHTLALMDRYKYFASMVPALIQKLDHYNSAVNNIAFEGVNEIIESGHKKRREATIVFSILRKNLFLSRKRLATLKEPDARLSQKLQLVRWAIKILGNQELRRLPKEVLNLL